MSQKLRVEATAAALFGDAGLLAIPKTVSEEAQRRAGDGRRSAQTYHKLRNNKNRTSSQAAVSQSPLAAVPVPGTLRCVLQYKKTRLHRNTEGIGKSLTRN